MTGRGDRWRERTALLLNFPKNDMVLCRLGEGTETGGFTEAW